MGSKNVKTVREQFEALNRRDLDAGIKAYAEDAVATDHSTSETFKGRAEIKQWFEMYFGASTDARVTLDEVIDAGDTVVVQLRFEGTNDGPLGPLPATGRHFAIDVCDVVRFNEKGLVVSDDGYFDQLGLMVQLGHMEAPAI